MQKIAGIIVLAVGILLIGWGFNASQSTGSDISRAFTGAPTDKAIYLIVGGAVAALAGGWMMWPTRASRT